MVIVAREDEPRDRRLPSKTSLVMATKHERGALARGIAVLSEHGLNLTKLESRPRPNTPWEYRFYLDFEGDIDDPEVATALEQLAEHYCRWYGMSIAGFRLSRIIYDNEVCSTDGVNR